MDVKCCIGVEVMLKWLREVFNMALKRFSVTVSEDMHAWIAEQAEKRGLTMNAVVIFALETYRKQEEVGPQMQLLNELINSGMLIEKEKQGLE